MIGNVLFTIVRLVQAFNLTPNGRKMKTEIKPPEQQGDSSGCVYHLVSCYENDFVYNILFKRYPWLKNVNHHVTIYDKNQCVVTLFKTVGEIEGPLTAEYSPESINMTYHLQFPTESKTVLYDILQHIPHEVEEDMMAIATMAILMVVILKRRGVLLMPQCQPTYRSMHEVCYKWFWEINRDKEETLEHKELCTFKSYYPQLSTGCLFDLIPEGVLSEVLQPIPVYGDKYYNKASPFNTTMKCHPEDIDMWDGQESLCHFTPQKWAAMTSPKVVLFTIVQQLWLFAHGCVKYEELAQEWKLGDECEDDEQIYSLEELLLAFLKLPLPHPEFDKKGFLDQSVVKVCAQYLGLVVFPEDIEHLRIISS